MRSDAPGFPGGLLRAARRFKLRLFAHLAAREQLREQAFLAGRFSRLGNAAVFVQVGSHDGVSGDPLCPFIAARNWRGLMIEPVPHLFRKLAARYGSRPSLTLLNLAVAPKDSSLTFWTIAEDIGRGLDGTLPAWIDQLSSFRREHLLRYGGPQLEPHIVALDVPSKPLADILHEHRLGRVDLLHIDAEGFDFEVLGTFPLDAIQPAMILIEHKHLSRDNFKRLLHELERHSYALTMLSSDLLAERPGPEGRS